MSALADAITSFLAPYKPLSSGITEEGNFTFSTERYTIQNGNHRIHIIVESKLQDLDEALQKALDDEDYHKANKIDEIIKKRKDDDPAGETEGT